MVSAHLPTADQIDRWANYLPAESELPRLVRRLIRRTAKPSRLDAPAGSSVRAPGWDLVAEVREGNDWVPTGNSFWEMGTDRDPRRKAQDDYKKRTAETPEAIRKGSTFVFVT